MSSRHGCLGATNDAATLCLTHFDATQLLERTTLRDEDEAGRTVGAHARAWAAGVLEAAAAAAAAASLAGAAASGSKPHTLTHSAQRASLACESSCVNAMDRCVAAGSRSRKNFPDTASMSPDDVPAACETKLGGDRAWQWRPCEWSLQPPVVRGGEGEGEASATPQHSDNSRARRWCPRLPLGSAACRQP